MTVAVDLTLQEQVARWLADDCTVTAGGVPFWEQMHPDTQARYRLAAGDLLRGPLADALLAVQRVRGLYASWRDSGEDPRLWIALRRAVDGDAT
jgi:hypothetical protein